jgi:3'-phosphoadenosine 5'-phosphosulfate sulfotransferase (PAPS reductase)/FAD synthetase
MGRLQSVALVFLESLFLLLFLGVLYYVTMSSFTELFASHISPTDTIVLAVSGGVDSMVLLDMVLGIHNKKNIIVAHFDHSLR